MIFRRSCLCLALCLGAALNAGAQACQPLARRYTQTEGLPSNNVNEILQDAGGYIWVATGAGVCRFDGYGFVCYPETGGQTAVNAYALETDEGGRVWAVTINGLLYRVEGDSLRASALNAALQPYREHAGVPHDFYLAGNEAWLSLGQLGVLNIRQNGGAPTLFEPRGRPGLVVAEAAPGRLLAQQRPPAGTPDRWPQQKTLAAEWVSGTLRFSIDIPLPPRAGPVSPVAMACGPGRYLLVHAGRIYFLENHQVKWFRDEPKRIFQIVFDAADGSVFLALHEGGGLRRYAGLEALRAGKFTSFAAGESVRHFFRDRAGGWWLSTMDRGILYYPNPNVWVFEPFAGMEQSVPFQLCFKDRQTCYVGSSKGQVFEWDVWARRVRRLPPLPFPTPVYGLAYDTYTKRLWAATNYLQYFENGRWHSLSFSGDRGLPGQRLRLDTAEPLLYASSGKGILALNRQTLQVERSSFRTHQRLQANAIETDGRGGVWVATAGGLRQWTGDSLAPPRPAHPALRQPVSHIEAPAQGGLLLSAGEQLIRWEGERIRVLQERSKGEFSRFHFARMDAGGGLWAASQHGLAHWPAGSVAPLLYGTAQGLPAGAVLTFAFQSDTIWLCTAEGLAVMAAKQMPRAALLRPIIGEIRVNLQPRAGRPGMHLAYRENNLQFQLTALSYATAGHTRYRYRLHPDEPWAETGQRNLTFFSLGPGAYRLEVQAQNADGIWGDTLRYDWVIRPPFWRSWWFLTLVAGAVLGGILWFFQNRIRQIRKEADYHAKIAALERAALQAQMNPHFIFNCLNSIQHFILKNDSKQATLYLSSFARLVRDTLHASVSGKVSLEEEIRMLSNYLSLEKLRFKDRFDYAIEKETDTDGFDIEFPPLLIQPIVENAILHGMKDLDRPGRIQVHFKTEGDQLIVRVTDNGRGLPEPALSLSNAGHRSVGMNLTTRRLDLLQGRGHEPSIQQKNRTDETGKVIGTEVVLRIPVRHPG